MAAAAALLSCVPALFTGFALDDYVLLRELSGRAAPEWAGTAPFDLFRWFEPANARLLMDGRGLAWWTGSPAQCAFFRPLASLTHTLDYALAPHSALLAHLHSLLWFGLLLAIANRTYSALLKRREVANLASLLFALDYAHGSAVGWISNRNALIGGTFGIATLLFHHRSRSRDSMAWAWAAWLCLACALLSAELSVGILGYLFAYAVYCDHASLGRRARSLGPYALITALWAATRAALNYQSFGVGVYTDPLQNPLTFARTLPRRWFLLMGSQLGRLSSDLHALVPPIGLALLTAVAAALCCYLLWFVWPTLRASRTQRFMALGAALSAIPLTATLPNDRLLVLVGFGALAPLAETIWISLARLARLAAPIADNVYQALNPLRQLTAAVASVGHTFGCLLILPITAMSVPYIGSLTEEAEREIPSDAAIQDQVLIVAGVPDSMRLAHARNIRIWRGTPTPEKLYWLQEANGTTEYERRDERTLRVHTPAGMFRANFETLGVRPILPPGAQVHLADVTITVIESNKAGKPSVCDFNFHEPLESPHYRWLSWQDGGLRPFQPPKMGDVHNMVLASGTRAEHEVQR